jgi:hypothetical protein
LTNLSCEKNSIICLPNIPTNLNFTSSFDKKLCAAPQIISFTPQNNQTTNQVKIIGDSFIGVTFVRFNGVEAEFTVNNFTEITVIVPKNATTGKITVTTLNGTAISQENFTINNALNIISGRVIYDDNANCQTDILEKGIDNIVIKVGDYYVSTAQDGNYRLQVPAGTYSISQILPKAKQNVFVPTCAKNYTVTFSGTNETKSGFDFFNKITNCTALTIDIASDRRRRCFKSITTVTYKNEGFADAQNVQIKVIYPKYVVPVRSTLKWDSQKDSLLTFNVGTLKAGETKRFVITDSVVCGNESIRGLSQCTKAIISPASSCMQESADWDKASIEVDGYCEGDYANFSIKNVGRGDMKDSTNCGGLWQSNHSLTRGKCSHATSPRQQK